MMCVCEKYIIDKQEELRGKWKRTKWLIYTYVYMSLRIYVCTRVKKKVFKFQTTLHIWSAITDSLRVETEQEKPKGSKIWRAPGVKFKFDFLVCKSI